jgi:predicted homoserine dehydrogenase-like protein
MYEQLIELERDGRPIRIVLTGASGRMGHAIAHQIGKTPGLRLVAAVGRDLVRAARAADLHGRPWALARTEGEMLSALRSGETVVTDDALGLLDRGREGADVLVEATSTVGMAAQVVERALQRRLDVVLLNAEVQCLLGLLLEDTAQRAGAVLTSDAGDQHGVLMRMIDEMRLWGMEIVMAGNIKGFLDRYATPESIAGEAEKRGLNATICTAFTDGTKLNVEMALVANAAGLLPATCGMLGPRVGHVTGVDQVFDLPSLRHPGVVDYVIGAEPDGGVFLVGHSDDTLQQEYLRYYKMGHGPFYIAYRPYHLCHLETPLAIATVAFQRTSILAVRRPAVAEVVAFAKTDLAVGTPVPIGGGGPHVYGQIDRASTCAALGAVPISLIETVGPHAPHMRRAVPRDHIMTWDDIYLPDGSLMEAWHRQQELIETIDLASASVSS